MDEKIVKNLLFFLSSILFVGTFFWAIESFLNNYGSFPSERVKASFYYAVQENVPSQMTTESIFEQSPDLTVDAQSYISMKINKDEEKVLLSKNEDERLPIASLVKLMNALIVLDNYDMKKKVLISPLAMKQEGEQGNLKLGEELSVKDLLYISLIESSNRASFALSEVMGINDFIIAMNSRAENLGLINTHFEDVTGLGDQSYSSAKDIAKLSGYMFNNYPLFGEVINLKEFDLYNNGTLHHKLINTNKLLGEAPNVIGGKTGWTDFSRGCFMAIEKSLEGDGIIINVVLKSEDRFSEMQKLISLINTYY